MMPLVEAPGYICSDMTTNIRGRLDPSIELDKSHFLVVNELANGNCFPISTNKSWISRAGHRWVIK